MDDLTKRTWAEISLCNLRHNYFAIRRQLPEGCRFMGVVKADAYGHGDVAVSRLLQEAGADYLAVSCLDEALKLRENGITLPILILGHTPAAYTATLIEQDLTQAVTCLAKALEFSEAAQKLGKTLRVHMKIDTGMSRLGFLCRGSYFDEGVAHVLESCRLPGLDAEGIFTHFSVADEDDGESVAYTREQFELFGRMIDEVQRRGGFRFRLRHCANSGATLRYPEMRLDMVRPGLLLYGYGDEEGRFGLKPCMRLVSRITTIKHYEPGTSVSYGRHFITERTTRMAVLGIGYADGLPRLISNQCSFAVASGFAPQRGNICMDMCMADVTDIRDAAVDSEVEIFGEKNPIAPLCRAAQTIPYELLCAVSKRVPRVYVSNFYDKNNFQQEEPTYAFQ